MARPEKRYPGNAAGDFYVDSTCIDCDQCRRIAPRTFRQEDGHSIVFQQPSLPEEVRRAGMALVTCPTASIGTLEKHDVSGAVGSFPEEIVDGIHFCGFASEESFGASSYLVVRPEGNVLVDSPRFNTPLVRRMEELGGVRLMFLTHIDDVADHRKFRDHFGCERIMHAGDAKFPVERRIEGTDPVLLAPDLRVIPTPGHTRGHQVLLYRDRYLFTGDHLWWSRREGRLSASKEHNWFSWEEQGRSMERLLGYSFEWVLPGHGTTCRMPPEEMRRELGNLVTRMKA